jgi:hypothetical protein
MGSAWIGLDGTKNHGHVTFIVIVHSTQRVAQTMDGRHDYA